MRLVQTGDLRGAKLIISIQTKRSADQLVNRNSLSQKGKQILCVKILHITNYKWEASFQIVQQIRHRIFTILSHETNCLCRASDFAVSCRSVQPDLHDKTHTPALLHAAVCLRQCTGVCLPGVPSVRCAVCSMARSWPRGTQMFPACAPQVSTEQLIQGQESNPGSRRLTVSSWDAVCDWELRDNISKALREN